MGVSPQGAGTFYRYVIAPLGAFMAIISLFVEDGPTAGLTGFLLFGGVGLFFYLASYFFGTYNDD